MSQQNYAPRPQEEEIDLREQLEIYLKHWPWFLMGLVIAVIVAFIYLRYTTPTYKTVATVIIKDEKNGGTPSEFAVFSELGLFNGMGTNSIENEIGILRSKRLMTEVTKELNLNIRYFRQGNIRESEMFAERPFNVQLLNFEPKKFAALEDGPDPLFIRVTSAESFSVENKETGWKKKFKFGKAFSLPYADVLVTPNFQDTEEVARFFEDGPIKVVFGSIEGVAAGYRDRININLTDKNSSLIELGLADPVRDKAEQILDQLVAKYNQEAIADKNLVSMNTAKFIEERLGIISQELDSVETGKEKFKKENKLTDIEAESQLFIENASEFRNRQMEVETQLELVNTMMDYLKTEDGLLPSNLGFQKEGIETVIQSYNQLVLERDRILSGSTARNPVIVNLNQQIDQIRNNVFKSLGNFRTSLKISQSDLNEQEARINSQIAEVPSKEKQFRVIMRQQDIKEALYLFLLQKREETSLSLAVTAPKAKIVDSAYSSKNPVSPKRKIILLAALIIGLLIPFLIIYIRNLLDNKVRGRADMEHEIKKIPLVGEVPKVGKDQKELVEGTDRSVLAESFRILHTNLQYLLINTENKKGGNTLFVTSTVKGEGKTFVAFNLALTLANANKKVLLVGADLRNPQLQRYEVGAREHLGVSDYLVNPNLQLKQLVFGSDLHLNLDLFPSGSVPPNPSELWRQDRAAEMFAELRTEYDYIIVDTAPAMLVTDTFLINKFADLSLYVVRAGYTERKLLSFPVDSKSEGKLHEVGFILNDVDVNHFGYGNKYGYAYGMEKPGFWDRFKRK